RRRVRAGVGDRAGEAERVAEPDGQLRLVQGHLDRGGGSGRRWLGGRSARDHGAERDQAGDGQAAGASRPHPGEPPRSFIQRGAATSAIVPRTTALATAENSQSASCPQLCPSTTTLPIQCNVDEIGLIRSSSSPNQPLCAPVGKSVGANRASSTNRLIDRLSRLVLERAMMMIPSAASEKARTVPAVVPAPIASPTAPTSLPRNHT